ncbi:MAG: tRNA-dihydrouridine synthase family protein [Planctomycetota bacterium]|nr:tRNA-dihydrouridine synthase family protein [Planctomycetota bacterium]
MTLEHSDNSAPLSIGPVRLATPLLLAPIAGYCDLAFRTICREWGGVGLACTDLLSPQGLLRGTATSLDLAKTNDFDKPVGMQLYGSDPEIMAEGARWAVEHGASVVDINMGCPVDKVTKKDGGSKLLTDLSRAVKIAERVARELEKCPLDEAAWARRQGPRFGASSRSPGGGGSSGGAGAGGALASGGSRVVPLTCKMRLCWHTSDYESGHACSPHLARMLADVGVAAVTVHGRTTEMKFSGHVQLAGIARVVEEVGGRIPVIGNGDIREPEDAERMIRATGCAGVMIGRGALSTPWLFRDAWAHLQRVGLFRDAAPPAIEPRPLLERDKIETIRRFFDLMRQQRGDHYAMFQITRRVAWFAKRLRGLREGGWLDEQPSEGVSEGDVAALTSESDADDRKNLKPFKEAIRLARAPDEVYAALDAYLRGDRFPTTALAGAPPSCDALT